MTGSVIGGGLEYLRSSMSNEVHVRQRHSRAAYDVRVVDEMTGAMHLDKYHRQLLSGPTTMQLLVRS